MAVCVKGAFIARRLVNHVQNATDQGSLRPPQWFMVNYMCSRRLRWYLIGLWMAVGAMVFIGVGSWTERSWSLLFVATIIPPAMMLWFWNEDRPLNMERLEGD